MNHGPCDHVSGKLHIEGEDISSLFGLSELVDVYDLRIRSNPLLTNLEGLGALVHVSNFSVIDNSTLINMEGVWSLDDGGSVWVIHNNALINMRGLESLERLGYLSIQANESLRNMEGLSGLTRIGGRGLLIGDNGALESLDGLESLDTVLGELIIQDNNALTNINGLSSLTTVTFEGAYAIRIQRNAALVNLDGLSSLTEIPGALLIHLNDSLSDTSGLSSLTNVGNILHIAANHSLTTLDGLSALKFTGALGITNNAKLSDISGLSSLQTVEGWVEINWNPELTNVDGLSALTSIGGTSKTFGFLRIEFNALTNLDGLSALTSVGSGLYVGINPSLADCSGLTKLIDPIDDAEPGPGEGEVPDVGGSISFEKNSPGCNSIPEILASIPLAYLNAGLNDAWFNLETDGQGFFIIAFPEIKQMFMAWFTYDTERPPADVVAYLGEPGHRWLTAQGEYEENVAVLDVFVTVGGVFDSSQPITNTEPDGEIILEFSTCNAGTVTYDIASIDRQGVVPIERITLDNVSLCYLLGNQTLDASLADG